jgi:mRNA interferase MazF
MEKTFMNQGEIWKISLDPTIGAEMKKARPAVIVSNNSVGVLPLRVVVPITEWQEDFSDFPWLVKIKPNKTNGLKKTSTADTFQVRSVSVKRFVEKIGKLSSADMDRISGSLSVVFNLESQIP